MTPGADMTGTAYSSTMDLDKTFGDQEEVQQHPQRRPDHAGELADYVSRYKKENTMNREAIQEKFVIISKQLKSDKIEEKKK